MRGIIILYNYNSAIGVIINMYIDLATNVGERIKYYREMKNLTQATLAELSGCSSNHISAIERGLYCTRIDTLIAISDALEVSTDMLLFGECAATNTHLSKLFNQICEIYGEDMVYNLLSTLVSFNHR